MQKKWWWVVLLVLAAILLYLFFTRGSLDLAPAPAKLGNKNVESRGLWPRTPGDVCESIGNGCCKGCNIDNTDVVCQGGRPLYHCATGDSCVVDNDCPNDQSACCHIELF